ncbi:NAD(P)H-dependent oxidoreductase [Pelagicoccus sp. SDUM812003]|uniref:NADPH-dependent FMN reductase n=1 Tax=Pelagicoccus sp. SDUM812003 TaxID=3041267 RepID=UPI00280DD172|nr:NAD(P)H-dependent oxidoreductase [Pelagicoccus sp. SDUM812003]MDQ8203191.1 NAD(P)H-dependent oxidoreductase [Pelagicoccus sp. SDUM812003]
MNIAIISSSLNPQSKSRDVARALENQLASAEGVSVDFIDLQELPLPICDGGAAYGDPNTVALNERMESADAYVIATPIYNYGMNAALKNWMELSGRKMEGKVAGILCSAGGAMSYMSPMAIANALMLDFRVIILPRFVYTTGADWDGPELKSEIAGRLQQFGNDFLSLARKLA